MNHSVAADAEFLRNNHEAAAVTELQQDSLLQLQVQELLKESSLQIKIRDQAVAYAAQVAQCIDQDLPPISNALLEKAGREAPWGSRNKNSSLTTVASRDHNDDKTTQRQLHKLRVLPQHHKNNNELLLLKASANAHVLPTLERTVLLPRSLLLETDYRKGRYFAKRNAVAWIVAQFLASRTSPSQIKSQVYWRYWKNDTRKVVLLLVPDKDKPKFRLQLQFQMESLDWIPPLRLLPNRHNLGTSANNTSTAAAKGAATGSVFYNFALTEDARHCFLAAALLDEEQHLPTNTQAAAALLQIWCLQRGFWRGHDTLDAEQLQVFLSYLVKTKQVNARMAPLQVVTACCKLWSEWLRPLVDGRDDDHTNTSTVVVRVLPASAGHTESQTVQSSALAQLYERQTRESPLTDRDPPTLLELWQQQQQQDSVAAAPVVLLDSSMTHNFLGRWSPGFGRALQRQAARSLEALTTHNNKNSFRHLFLTPARFFQRHDAYMRIPLGDLVVEHGSSAVEDAGAYECLARRIVAVLRRALGDRVRAVECGTTGNGRPERSHRSAVADDSDEIPTFAVDNDKDDDNDPRKRKIKNERLLSPTGMDFLVLGITVNPDTCFRVVDRGPSNEQPAALRDFLALWGSKAELRRFQDGALVHAVVWEQQQRTGDGSGDQPKDDTGKPYISYQNDDTWQGGIVERIVRHILCLHFLQKQLKSDRVPQFLLRHMVSTVDGVVAPPVSNDMSSSPLLVNPLTAHRTAMKAFEVLADFLRSKSAKTIPVPGSSTEMKSALGIPLTIDAVEPLSPSLRYATLYPPVPHPMLGGAPLPGQKKASGAVQSDPIEIQIRFGASSKWPSDLKAIGAAKTAMLIAMVNGIDALKRAGAIDGNHHFDGPVIVTPSHADLCFMGYVFRIHVRADPELKLLRSLRQPGPEAVALLQKLTRTTVIAATHHSMVHAVYTSHPSSSAVVRLAKRWLSAHLLSDHLSFEALELLVAHVYTDQSSPFEAPGTATAGFLRFLQLLAKHDWMREPLIVDPQAHLSKSDYATISAQFDAVRGSSYMKGPAMYIVSPCTHAHHLEDEDSSNTTAGRQSATETTTTNKKWSPIFTASHPERVVLLRSVALAERTHRFLESLLMMTGDTTAWPAAFQETAESFRSYSALLRVDSAFAVNAEASSTANHCETSMQDGGWMSTYTHSMRRLVEGPKDLRRKLYRNLMAANSADEEADGILLEWNPVQAVVVALRRRLGHWALFFYNDLCPDVIAVVWRPFGPPRGFSALVSEFVQPTQTDDWQSDTMVTLNVHDLLREIAGVTVDIVTHVKVFDHGPLIRPSTASSGSKRKRSIATDNNQEDNSGSSSEG